MHEFVEEGPFHQLLAELLTERPHRCIPVYEARDRPFKICGCARGRAKVNQFGPRQRDYGTLREGSRPSRVSRLLKE
jgi:hypothetical protein